MALEHEGLGRANVAIPARCMTSSKVDSDTREDNSPKFRRSFVASIAPTEAAIAAAHGRAGGGRAPSFAVASWRGGLAAG